MGIVFEPFGAVDGESVVRYTLTNANGMAIRVLTYGGIIQTLSVPDRDGRPGNVVLGFATLDDYVRRNDPYFGAIAGRYANRIRDGRFVLDGRTIQLPTNDGAHTLHGGVRGFDKRVWDVAAAEELADGATLHLSRLSPDGEEGYPGALAIEVAYALSERNELRIDYRATTDAPTILNPTQHSYFNLAGEGSGTIDDHVLRVAASRYTPVDDTLLPSGELAPVAGTPFDFTTPRRIGGGMRSDHPQIERGRGFDHNLVLDRPDPDDGALRFAARVEEPSRGRAMEVHTTEPGIQFYTGNYLDGTLIGTSGRRYRQGDGFALETQHYPDSPNRPEFPSPVLRPGQAFASTTVYAFSIVG